ncbi:MAG: hypothetical protein RMM31_11410 [Anaerolineae bacterium]|nr:hypothetical protein [Anaerolineae bacterium]
MRHLLEAIRQHVVLVEQSVRSGHAFPESSSREQQLSALIEFVLRPMLPLRYGLMVGSAFSTDDLVTREDAVLIYDALYALPLGSRLTACEYVYALCETRLHLDGDQFVEALHNIASLKKLHRAKATAHDVSPTHHLGLFGARYAQLSDDKLNPYLGYIFARTSADPRALHQQLEWLIETDALRAEHTPDAVVCFDEGWILTRQTLAGEPAVPRSSFAKFGVWRPGANLLPLVYLLLNVSLSQIQLRGPDLLRVLSVLARQRGDSRAH